MGCEAAIYLALKGKKVTIIEMMGDIAMDVNLFAKGAIFVELEKQGIQWLTNMKLERVS